MAFEAVFPLPPPASQAAGCFPPLDTWLRLNPQWSLLAAPEPAGDDWLLHLRDEQSDEEIHARARYLKRPEQGLWQLGLADATYTVRLLEEAGGLGLRLTADGVADDDRAARTNLALWHRSTHDYILLSLRPGIGARLSKYALDRFWLKLSQPGRRLVFLVIAFEVAALALLVAWLGWMAVFG